MILFKPKHVQPILDGIKTQTRRLGKKRWNVGAHHQCRTRMLDAKSHFATVEILDVRREKVLDISHRDALAEGYGSIPDYLDAWLCINGGSVLVECWVVEFRLHQQEHGR